MSEIALLQNYLLVGAILFGLGITGLLVRRNLIVMLLSVEIMLQGISLSLTAWGRFHNDWGGQMMVVFVITVAACEAGIALALVLRLCRTSGSLDVVFWQASREDGMRAFVDSEIPEETFDHPNWPTLTPAGSVPADSQEEPHRRHV